MCCHPITSRLSTDDEIKLYGRLPEGCTATELLLTITQVLRKKGVVGKFVEFFGEGLKVLSLADRATVANMAPEYGATMGFFPVDQETLNYLRFTNRNPHQVALVEAYTKEQGLFHSDASPEALYPEMAELDLATVTTSMAGPKRPQDRVELPDVKKNFSDAFGSAAKKSADIAINSHTEKLAGGS